MNTTIRNPIEWSWDQLRHVRRGLNAAAEAARHARRTESVAEPSVRKIEARTLIDVLRRGLGDFGAYRTDVIVICIVYPVVGLVLGRALLGQELIPLLFPLASGFAIVGTFLAIGLYEMSRQRERGERVSWMNALAVTRSPAIGSVVALGLVLIAIFLAWLAAAWGIYAATLGPEPPASIGAFLGDVFGTAAGWALIVVGCGVGFLFALAAFLISVVSFPLLLDRDVGIVTAIRTSVRAVLANPVPMALWGLVVAGGLVLGSIPVLLGLIVVMPVLGHATWHLYRAVVGE